MSKSDAPAMIFTFALGVGVGAVAALLFAPKAGEDLRADIADSISDGVKHIERTGEDLQQRAQAFLDEAKGQVQDAFEAGETAFQKASKPATKRAQA